MKRFNKEKDSIRSSAIRRGFNNVPYNKMKQHLITEVAEVIDAWNYSAYDAWYDADKECGFFSELADIIILSISGELSNTWWCADSPFPIPQDTDLFILLLAKSASNINRVNSLPHTIIEWCASNGYENELLESFNSKIKYNKERKD